MYSNNVAGNSGNGCWNNCNVGGDFGRRNCNWVYQCLLELLEDAVGNNNSRPPRNCDFVYGCLEDLLEDALGDSGNNNHCCCRRN